jgi:hypothetical protein
LPTKQKRYVVRVKPYYRRVLPDNPIDQSSDGTFESKERADDWCQALNWCAGYDRFSVQEIAVSEKSRKQAA